MPIGQDFQTVVKSERVLIHGFSEKRKEPRYPTHDPAQLTMHPFTAPPMVGTIVDMSRSGLRVELPKSLARGSFVKIVLPGKMSIFGTVRHCESSGVLFQAGVLIESVTFPTLKPGEHPDHDDFALYAAGVGLTAAQTQRIENHLAACEYCGRWMADLDSVLWRSQRLPPRDARPA